MTPKEKQEIKDFRLMSILHGMTMLLIEGIDDLERSDHIWACGLKYRGKAFQDELIKKAQEIYKNVHPSEEKSNNDVQNVLEKTFKGLGSRIVDELWEER